RLLEGHRYAVRALAFSPDGRAVLTGGEDHTARPWEAATGKTQHVFQHPDVVRTVAFIPDWRAVLSGRGAPPTRPEGAVAVSAGRWSTRGRSGRWPSTARARAFSPGVRTERSDSGSLPSPDCTSASSSTAARGR